MRKILLLFFVFLLIGCSNDNITYKTITNKEARELVNNSEVIIIDVRTEPEYNSNHIENAINIPLDDISEDKLELLINSKEINIIVYCQSGFRSRQAASKIFDFGYNNVYDLGSIDNWEEQNVK